MELNASYIEGEEPRLLVTGKFGKDYAQKFLFERAPYCFWPIDSEVKLGRLDGRKPAYIEYMVDSKEEARELANRLSESVLVNGDTLGFSF
jgi:hypothetical protein